MTLLRVLGLRGDSQGQTSQETGPCLLAAPLPPPPHAPPGGGPQPSLSAEDTGGRGGEGCPFLGSYRNRAGAVRARGRRGGVSHDQNASGSQQSPLQAPERKPQGAGRKGAPPPAPRTQACGTCGRAGRGSEPGHRAFVPTRHRLPLRHYLTLSPVLIQRRNPRHLCAPLRTQWDRRRPAPGGSRPWVSSADTAATRWRSPPPRPDHPAGWDDGRRRGRERGHGARLPPGGPRRRRPGRRPASPLGHSPGSGPLRDLPGRLWVGGVAYEGGRCLLPADSRPETAGDPGPMSLEGATGAWRPAYLLCLHVHTEHV